MKKLQNWIIAGVIAAIVILAGYFVSSNVGNQTAEAPTTTSQEQEKTIQTQVTINYAGDVDKTTETTTVSIEEGQTAWDVLKKAVGEENITYEDYGGDLGVFVSEINGVKPSGNKFWLFEVNGKGADVGVSSYNVQEGDKLSFVISEPSEGQ